MREGGLRKDYCVVGSGPCAGAVRGWITTGLARVAGEWSPGPGRLPTHPPRDERRPRVTCSSPSSFVEGPIRKDPERVHEAVSGRLSSRGGSRSSAALRACRPSPRPRPQCPGDPHPLGPCVPCRADWPPVLSGRGEKKSSTVMERTLGLPTAASLARRMRRPKAVPPRSDLLHIPRTISVNLPRPEGTGGPGSWLEAVGRGGWVPLCLVSAPGGVSAGALSRGLRNSNFEEPQPRRVKPEDTPSRRAL